MTEGSRKVDLRYALRKGPNNYVYLDLTKSYGPSNNGTGRWHVASATPDQMRLETPLADFYCKIRDIALLNGGKLTHYASLCLLAEHAPELVPSIHLMPGVLSASAAQRPRWLRRRCRPPARGPASPPRSL